MNAFPKRSKRVEWIVAARAGSDRGGREPLLIGLLDADANTCREMALSSLEASADILKD